MTGSLQLGLRAGDRIYINGAVLRVDRKVRLELLYNATFLLGAHVMQLNEATTPMRQLYFLVQGLLMDPGAAAALRGPIEQAVAAICKSPDGAHACDELAAVSHLIGEGSVFEALKKVRQLMQQHDNSKSVTREDTTQSTEIAQ